MIARLILAVFLCAAALPASAAEPLSAGEFEDYVTGKTLYYAAGGFSYGVEEYLPHRRVRWSFLDGDCKEGEWYEDQGRICFTYEDGTGPQCWHFFLGSGGLRARFLGDAATGDLYETHAAEEPLVCPGPRIGV